MGAGRPQEVMPIARRIIRICYMIIIPLMFFVFVQPTLLLHIYTDNEALIKESIPSLFTMVLYYLITVPGSILFNTVA